MQDRKFFNCDCIEGARKYVDSESVDLIISDPPYGIDGDKLNKHYNRNEGFVLDGYVEIPKEEYAGFSRDWIAEAERILKPGGSIYIVSGYTNLVHVLNALSETNLVEVNHIIWKFNFGVYTKTKYISSHYHLLFYRKPGKKHTFNTFSRYSDAEHEERGGSSNYRDREDVWIINREYKPGKLKNKNELPVALLKKMIQYSSNEGDLVCDMFLGSFSTAKVAIGLNRRAIGFEVSKVAFEYQSKEVEQLRPGYLVSELRVPPKNKYFNRGKPISASEAESILMKYAEIRKIGMSKKASIDQLSEEFGRGYWSLLRVIDGTTNKSVEPSPSNPIQTRLF